MTSFVFKLLRFSGLPYLFRELVQKNKVSILLFHDISRETAEQTFTYLSKKYNIIGLNDFLEACEQQDYKRIPKKAMIITFDDGHIQNYDMLPVIKKYNIPVTIFLCSEIVDTNRHFWFLFPHPTISDQEFKRVSNAEKLRLLKQAGFTPQMTFDTPQALTKEQLEEMKPYVNFQAHTQFHPCLPQCDDKEAQAEIADAKKALESKFNLSINAIAYPNGDYSKRDILLSQQAGYQCGLTVDFGFNTINSDLFRLKRFDVNDTADLNELIVKSSGLWGFLKTRNGRKQPCGLQDSLTISS